MAQRHSLYYYKKNIFIINVQTNFEKLLQKAYYSSDDELGEQLKHFYQLSLLRPQETENAFIETVSISPSI